MKKASDHRRLARESLRGKWFLAILTGLVAILLGGGGAELPHLGLSVDGGRLAVDLSVAGVQLFSTSGAQSSFLSGLLAGGAGLVALVSILAAVFFLVLGSVVETGYAGFNLSLIDGQRPALGSLFKPFRCWTTTTVALLLRSIFTLLWSLLLVFPGIMAAYSYAMTPYILAEDPQLRAREAIARSKAMMRGNRWKLFCLRLSFIGWDILATLTLGIGNLWLRPYREAANAAFYRMLTGADAV